MKMSFLFFRSCFRVSGVVLILLAAGWAARLEAGAATIWNGPLLSFTEAPGSNPSLPANQDRITAHIWLTRGSIQGLFNAETESGFTHFLSPAGTMWADGTTANYSSLVYHDWNTWAKSLHGGPPNTVRVNAVLHLVADDIYLNVRFDSWGGSGGGFSYERSTLVPEPSSALVLLTGLMAGVGLPYVRGRGHVQSSTASH